MKISKGWPWLTITAIAMIVTLLLVANSHGLIARLIRINSAAISLGLDARGLNTPLIIFFHILITAIVGRTTWILTKLARKLEYLI